MKNTLKQRQLNEGEPNISIRYLEYSYFSKVEREMQ